MSVAYIRAKSRTERPRKAKIGTEVASVVTMIDIDIAIAIISNIV